MSGAMVWIARSGAHWQDLPVRCGPWVAVNNRQHPLLLMCSDDAMSCREICSA
ncbi:hypothetical protein V3C10_22670 [[Clostridium] symbiosum]|uniref:hypothetical protein n=1 Tax=Clostridium symbiosum TaxID=1512 RepID=UPI0025701B00|nr:hypothetical protein [[Clostridium] symbiosum]